MLAWLSLDAAPAVAATVSSYQRGDGSGIRVLAAPGEANRLAVEVGADVVVLTDSGTPFTAEADCTQVDAHTVRCPSGTQGSLLVFADLADGDDTFGVSGTRPADRYLSIVVRGGPGNDNLSTAGEIAGDPPSRPLRSTLSGGDGQDQLTGSVDSDTLSGGKGDDVSDGGTGDDEFLERDNDNGRDVLSGGPGRDKVSYKGLLESVRVDLSTQTGGTASQPDDLDSIEDAAGGRRADVLTGDDAANFLKGGWSPENVPGDEIRGLGGEDYIVGSPNADVLRGGAGRDDIIGAGGDDSAFGGSGDDFLTVDHSFAALAGGAYCGSGRDSVSLPQDPDEDPPLVSRDCERVYSNSVSFWLDYTNAVLRLTIPPDRPNRSSVAVGCTLTMRFTGTREPRQVTGRNDGYQVVTFAIPPRSKGATLYVADTCNEYTKRSLPILRLAR